MISCTAPFVPWRGSPETTSGPPPGAVWEGEAFTFHKVRDDIYHAVGTGSLTVGCNGSVIINENDILLVDSHMTPAASWALMKELENITDKPVRYVVNTHFHFDHAHGNQTFGDDVEIIGHKYTREQLRRRSFQGRPRVGDVRRRRAPATHPASREHASSRHRLSGELPCFVADRSL